MSITLYTRSDCRLCGCEDLEPVLELAPSALADDYLPPGQAGRSLERHPLRVRRCPSCGQVQLGEVASPEAIYGDYIYRTASSPGLEAHFDDYAADAIERLGLRPGTRALDLGCNDGALLRALGRRGLVPFGVEPARKIASQLEATGIEVYASFFSPELADTIRDERGEFGLVTANNVLANVDEVATFVEGVARLLAPDGVFVIETGSLRSLIENTVFDNIYHEHLSYFSVTALEKFLARHGLELFDVEWIPTKGGSIRCFSQRAGGPRAITPAVPEQIEKEERAGLFGPVAFRDLARRIDETREELFGELDRFRSAGQRICGYGASATCTTVIHALGLGEHLDFLVDDNPLKHGRVSPGYHLPVLPSAELVRRGVDVAVILPWRFREGILERNARYRKTGGQFLTLLPRVEVLP